MSDPGPPGISVVTPVTRESVRDAVASIFAQTYAGPIEVITVRDGGDGFELPPAPDGVTVQELSLGVSRGPSAARNAGIRAATGELVAFLDDDDLWLPDKLRIQVAALRPDQTGSFTGLQYAGDHVATVHARSHTEAIDPLEDTRFLAPSTFLCRRQPLLDVGGFDDELRVYEDLDLYIRLVRSGARLFNIPDVLTVMARDNRPRLTDGYRAWASGLAQLEAKYPDLRRVAPELAAVLHERLAWRALDAGLRREARGHAATALDLDGNWRRRFTVGAAAVAPEWMWSALRRVYRHRSALNRNALRRALPESVRGAEMAGSK